MTRRGRSRDAGHARRRALRRGRPIPQFNGYEVDTVFHYEEDALRVIFPDTSMARNFSSRMQEELYLTNWTVRVLSLDEAGEARDGKGEGCFRARMGMTRIEAGHFDEQVLSKNSLI